MENPKIEAFNLPKLNATNMSSNTETVKEDYIKGLQEQTKEELPQEVKEEREVITPNDIKKISEDLLLIQESITKESDNAQIELKKLPFVDLNTKLDNIIKDTEFLSLEFKKQTDLLLAEQTNDNILKLIEYGKHLDDKIDKIQEKNTMLVKKILKKILNKEITENSEKIVSNTFNIIYSEIKNSSKIDLYVSEKDFNNINEHYEDNEIVTVTSDSNIKPGHCLIISDNMNYDNNLDKKLDLILESIF